MQSNSKSGTILPKAIGAWLILVFFTSLKMSFFLEMNQYLLAFFLLLLLLVTIGCSKEKILQFKNENNIVILLFVFAALLGERGNFNAYIGLLILILPFLLFLCFKDVYKIAFLKILNNVLSISILISLCAWVLFLIGVQLPHYSIDWLTYSFENYYFFLYTPSLFYALPRYEFVFTEPGYFACLMVFMIYLQKYNFREWRTIVYFIALILTYSMSGFIMFFIGLIPYVIANKKNRLKYLMMLFALLLGFLYLTLNGQDNAFSEMFTYRMEIVDGTLSGYNRNNKDFDYWWEHYFMSKGDILWGNNAEISRVFKDDFFGVDLRAYVARFGLIPLIFYFGSLIYYYRKNKSILGCWFLLLFLIFYYRGYTVMYYIGFSLLFSSGLCYLNQDSQLSLSKKNK